MATTVNEQLRDRVLLRLVLLQRYSNSEVRSMLATLAQADVALYARLAAALERLPAGSFTVRRLDALLSGVWGLNESAYRQLATATSVELEKLVASELRYHEATWKALLPVGQAAIGVPDWRPVWAAVKSEPFRGRLLSEWFDSLAAGRQVRLRDALRVGYVQGLTVDELVRSVRGTKAQNYTDGILSVDRRNAEAVVRTAIAHTSATARNAFYADNAKFIKEEQWLSTLDNRTTDLCMARDGKRYSADDKHAPIGHALPWLEGPGQIHWNCRSVSVPVIDSAKELGFELPEVERAAMNGVAAPGTTYAAWLRGQSAAVQDQVLGPARGKLYRSGEITFDRFFNDQGKLITLAQLEATS